MANPHKGEVAFSALGRSFVMRLDVDAICDAEAALDLGIEEIIERIKRGGNMRIVRALMRAGLGDPSNSAIVPEIITEMRLAGAMALCVEAIQAAFPSPEDASENPPGPLPVAEPEAAGTGTSS